MKPDWKDAPDWANYLAMDENGAYHWFANVPQQGLAAWIGAYHWVADVPRQGRKDYTNVRLAAIEGIVWRNSLEKRP